MKTINIEIPDGKKAEWVNGVLTLVDEQPQNVMERVRTFVDAIDALGEEHQLVKEYRFSINACANNGFNASREFRAYLKLRIITAALNEGWEPNFTKDEFRCYPLLNFYTQAEIDKMDDEARSRFVGRSNNNANAYDGLACADSYSASSYAVFGTRLAFKTSELAAYAGRQFAEIYCDFVFKPE